MVTPLFAIPQADPKNRRRVAPCGDHAEPQAAAHASNLKRRRPTATACGFHTTHDEESGIHTACHHVSCSRHVGGQGAPRRPSFPPRFSFQRALRRAPRRGIAQAWRVRALLALAAVVFVTTMATGVQAAHASAVEPSIPISELAQRLNGPTQGPAEARTRGAPTFSPSSTSSAQSSGRGTLPRVHQSLEGTFDPGIVPPDTNGAAGPTRQIEIMNLRVGIWSRSSPSVLLADTTLQALTGSSGPQLGDPRVMWDPQTSRFYYTVLDDTNSALLTGFSTTGSPSSAADWCRYAMPQPSRIDQPHLGDSKDFVLIGFYLYYAGPEVAWYAKPPAGPACPASLKRGVQSMPSANGYPPAPADEVDVQATGYVLAAGNANDLTMIKVSKDSSGAAVFSAPASISVTPFTAAPSAPQQGASQSINVGDPRLQGVVGALDPSRAGKFALWTQHTVAGGAGSMIRWYEIDPSAPGLFQSGTVQSPTLWEYNGAISPDRLVNGSIHKFGDAMVLAFNTSSSTTNIAIQIVSKIGSASQSTPVLVKASAAPYLSFDCVDTNSTCHWGDYSGAAPDPKANPTGSHGVVWAANEWNTTNPNPTSGTAWRTWIFTASP